MRAPVFTQGYVEAAFFADIDHPDVETYGATVSDLAPSAWFAMVRDCARFMRRHGGLIAQATAGPHYSNKQAGRDFWFSRNGHGAGYFDRGLGDVGDALQTAARGAGSVDIYRGDDGKLYQLGVE